MAKAPGKPAFEVRIDPARPGDEEDIARLIAALAEYEKAPEQCEATAEKVRRQLFGERPAASAIMARVGAKVVGFALYFTTFSTWLCKPGLYLEDLFVLPAFRKKGIGGALLRRLAAICVEKDYGRMEWACLEWNELAKAQYRKVGAVPMDEWRTWRLTGEALAKFGESAIAKQSPSAKRQAELEQEPSDKDVVEVYTDGGCRPNPGVGGWAAVLIHGDRVKELSGGEMESTNNRMELLSAINALEALKKPCKVEFHTDSQYVKNGITTWIAGWKKKGWRRGKEELKNVDLWKRLDAAVQRHSIRWFWIRGHAGDKYNEICDQLCTTEIERLEKLRDKKSGG